MGQRAGPGKIAGLVRLLREHGAAIEADLAFRAGPQDQLTQLGRGLQWRRLEALILGLAKTPGTLLHRELAGDDWTLDQHLLAVIADRLGAANWQRGGGKGARPKPISPLAQRATPTRTGDAGGHGTEETLALLEGYRTGVFDRG